jgi:S-methylmethionine-dependent homocysteine/selenocysteine methylase
MMTKAPSQSAIAAALGISQPAVAQLKRRGMPCDTIEAAQAWHRRNVRPRQRRVPRTRTATSETQTPDDVADAATTATTLEELAELRAIARRGLADAQAAGDDYSLRSWTLAQAKILDQSATTEERLLAIAKDKGQLLTVGQAREAFGTVLVDIRKLLDAAPSALAAKVNPQDPDHSRAIIEDWRNGVLRTLHRGEERTPGA